MNNVLPLAPLLGGLGSFAFACVIAFALIQQMRRRDDRANSREDRMMALVENHLTHNTETLGKLSIVIEKLDTTITLTRPQR